MVFKVPKTATKSTNTTKLLLDDYENYYIK